MAVSKKQNIDNIINSYLNNELDINQLFNQYESITNKKITSPNIASNDPIIVVDNFTKQYRGSSKPAVEKISFSIYPGQFHVFIGANGAGKTTTIKAIIGAYSENHYDGTITINGINNQKQEAKRFLGYIPENANFPRKMNAINYLVSMAMLAGYTSKLAKQKANEILTDLKMEQFAKKNPYSFSSGQKKKILLAQALLNEPQVLVMDEPAANLDPLAREELFETLTNLQKQGIAIFLSSHILDEVDKYATHATIIDGGHIVYSDALDKKSDLSSLYRKYVKLGSVDNN